MKRKSKRKNKKRVRYRIGLLTEREFLALITRAVKNPPKPMERKHD